MERPKEPMINYWYRALHSPFGVELICSDVERTRAKLYEARRSAKDPELGEIALSISPFDHSRLWLVKKDELPEK